ncbi:diguanylate cyclase [Amycolatopsis cynarae]|uniref:Diguanylate cyclase n=1 Tax=Amycolatopsis cynarae TaxID=2995223 RepID=A0ABY7AST2_9PSEU|nr:diguanylate cyclase [Amycolatopsis sp. HUAS 11-8]WAL63010.1 diguanylate cyclase [Amycolatopsis sp. HUAS 11-8]
MPEPGDAPGLVEVVQRWTARWADTDGVSLSPAQLEELVAGVARDAAARAEAARDAALRRFSALYSASPIGIALADPNGEIVEANAALGAFLGCKTDDLRGRDLADLGYGPKDRHALLDGLDEVDEAGSEPYRQRVQLAHADDVGTWADITLAVLPGDRPGAAYPVLMVLDANEVHQLQETLRHQSIHDPLTGLSNASRFNTLLEGALGPSARDQIALVYLDIDGFKVINDGLGAGVGDKVLRRIARRLREVFTSHDPLIARLSGDGFAVLLRGRLTAQEVITQVQRALDELREPMYVDDHGIGVSASAGIVVRDVADGGPEDLLRAAELALHRAKAAGKAQWMLFDPDLDVRDRARYRLGAEIGGALENGHFELVYQPMVKLGPSGGLAAVNAGLRWNHPEFGELGSEEFYPLADTTGMTVQLGNWLLTESLAAAARWRERHGEAAPDICIRLPGRLAVDPELVGAVKELLDRYRLPAGALRLCTDSPSLHDPRGEVLESLSVLTDLGAKMVLAVTGSADLELIPRQGLKVRQIILTGPVVDALGDNPDAAAVRHLDQLVARARELGLRVGADGVRTTAQAELLRGHGVIAARGPFVTDSATGDEVDDLIERYTG